MATIDDYELLREFIAEDATAYPDARLDPYLDQVEYTDADDVVLYDLHRAASRIWLVKAGLLARRSFDSQVDATKAARSQQWKNAYSMYRLHARLARPTMIEFTSPSAPTTTVDDE